MNRLETLIHKREAKAEKVGSGIELFTPESGIGSQVQAGWMIAVLSQIYFEHGITANVPALEAAIASGDCRCWFAVKDDQPVACSALIKQADGSVELGRAASLAQGKGVGGILMLDSAIDHFTQSDMPLVAEVRTAAEFNGVPGSEATQVIMFKHIGLEPHAIVPMFGHGKPHRQEQFILGTSQVIEESEPMWWPMDQTAHNALDLTIGKMVRGKFLKNPRVNQRIAIRLFPGWEVDLENPFAIVKFAGGSGVDLEKASDKALAEKPFVLMPIAATPENTGLINLALGDNFVPCGVDRQLDENGFPVLLFGKLSPKVSLAPTIHVPGLFDQEQLEGMIITNRLMVQLGC